MRVQTICQNLCYNVVFCCLSNVNLIFTAAVAMVQQRNNNVWVPVSTVSEQMVSRRQSFAQCGCLITSGIATVWPSCLTSSNAMEVQTQTLKHHERSLDDTFVLATKLGRERIGATGIHTNSLLLSRPSKAFDLLASNEPLYYPAFMFGAWNVTAKLTMNRSELPVVQSYNTRRNEIDVIGINRNDATNVLPMATEHFQQQYFSTIANTLQNQITINLGTGMPETKIISNRAYNLRSELLLLHPNATLSTSVPIPIPSDDENLEWDYRSSIAPTRVSWWDDSRSKRYDYETIAHQSEVVGSNEHIFAATEHHRFHIVDESGLGNAIETITTTEYQTVSDNIVRALSSIVVMLDSPTPNSETIMVFEYDLSMYRIVQSFTNRNNDDRVAYRPCVETPRGIIQCY